LLTHIADVDHLIKLHVDYPQATLDIEPDKLWIILRQTDTQYGSINVSEITIERVNYNQSDYDLQGNVTTQLFLCPNIAPPTIPIPHCCSSTTSEAIQAYQLILNALRLFSLAPIHVDTPTFGINIMGPLPLNPPLPTSKLNC